MIPHLSKTPDYDRIDSNIRDLVKVINDLGIETYASCEGHLDTRCSQVPYVLFNICGSTEHSFCHLVQAVGTLNNIFDINDWIFVPNNRVGNGSPFLTLRPKYSQKETSAILKLRHQQVVKLVEILNYFLLKNK